MSPATKTRDMLQLRALLPATLALSILAEPLVAQSSQQKLTLEHLRKLTGVGGVEISPDGKTAVVTVSHPNYATDKSEGELFAVDVPSGATRQLTFERRSVGWPHFAPDGRTLAFLSPDSAHHTQIWLLPMNGGETRRLTSMKNGVDHFA